MASPISALTGSQTLAAPRAGSSVAGVSAPNQEMFLQLLVAQLKNQDPLSPTDGTQFVSQLAQFSELEQVIAIRGDIEANASALSPTTTPGSSLVTTPTGQTQS
jgi:flagellar basal-body rod modification protein FlgD